MSELMVVVKKDKKDLQALLESGWSPPRVFYKKSGWMDDFLFWTETILRDWVEGLQLLDEYFPEQTKHPDVWETALRNSSIECIVFLWERLSFHHTTINEQTKEHWLRCLMAGVGDRWDEKYNTKDVGPVIEFLKSKNIDISGVFPGEFETNDFRLNGHSLFTRAVSIRRWDLMDILWSTTASWKRWAKINEVLYHLMEVTCGDYRHFEQSFDPSISMEKDVLIRFLKDYGSEWCLQHPAIGYLSKSHKLRTSPERTIIMDLADPTKDKISPWLRLPLFVNEEDRKMIWKIWSNVMKKDDNLLWFNALVIDPSDVDALQVLKLFKSEQPYLFKKYWKRQEGDGENATSLENRWKELGGGKI